MGLVTKDFTFTAGNVIVASEHNSNFDNLYNLVNGNIENSNIKSSAAIANTKLAAPKSYFMLPLCADGQFTANALSLFSVQMPFAATLTEVCASARDIDTSSGDEVYTIDVLEASSSVLSSVINLTADASPVIGTISDSSIADNAFLSVDLKMGGTSPTIDDLTVLLTFKINHVS